MTLDSHELAHLESKVTWTKEEALAAPHLLNRVIQLEGELALTKSLSKPLPTFDPVAMSEYLRSPEYIEAIKLSNEILGIYKRLIRDLNKLQKSVNDLQRKLRVEGVKSV